MFLGNPLTAQVLVPPTLTETSVASLTVNPMNSKLQWIHYPNPATDHLQITGLKTATNYIISSMIGANLQSGNTLGSIDIATLPSGIYNLMLQNSTRKEVFHFLKK